MNALAEFKDYYKHPDEIIAEKHAVVPASAPMGKPSMNDRSPMDYRL